MYIRIRMVDFLHQLMIFMNDYLKSWTNDDLMHFKEGNTAYRNKIPKGSEVANIFVGEFDFLTKPVSALVRLAKPTLLGDFTEVPLPSRFVFLMLGPKVTDATSSKKPICIYIISTLRSNLNITW